MSEKSEESFDIYLYLDGISSKASFSANSFPRSTAVLVGPQQDEMKKFAL
jgi:hypothetical protein